MQPIRVYAADGVPITQTDGKLDVNATLTASQIVLVDVGYHGQDVTTTTGANEAITIPADSTRAVIYAAKDSEGYINLNAAATALSPIFVNEINSAEVYLKDVTAMNAYVLTGTLGVIFYG